MWFVWAIVFIFLCIGGSVVYLIGHTIWLITKRNEKIFEAENKKLEEDENA